MTSESKKLQEAKVRLEHAEEINAVEAISEASAHGNAASLDIGLILGRVQMSQTFAKFADVVSLAVFKEIKETKGYRALKGKTLTVSDDVGEKQIVLKGTWDEFCRICHTSKSSVDERLLNLETFGENVLESMQSMGMTTRDIRKLRKLPPEDIKAIVDGSEVKVSDRDEALELIEDMATKHRKETQQLRSELAEAKQNNETNERLLADKNKKIDSLSKKLDKPLTEVQKRKQEEERCGKLLRDIADAENEIDIGLAHLFDAIESIQSESRPTDVDNAYEDALYRVTTRLLEFSMSLGLTDAALTKLKEFQEEASVYGLAEE